MAGAARNQPRPDAPTCRMSVAKIGSSATAPPKNTASRSRLSALRISLSRQTKRSPSSVVRQPCRAGARSGRGTRSPAKQSTAATDRAACTR